MYEDPPQPITATKADDLVDHKARTESETLVMDDKAIYEDVCTDGKTYQGLDKETVEVPSEQDKVYKELM